MTRGSWASVDDLPPERQLLPVAAPLQAAYRFSLDYQQCTNECYGRTYDVVFVRLIGADQTFWVQSTDLDVGAVDAMLDSAHRASIDRRVSARPVPDQAK